MDDAKWQEISILLKAIEGKIKLIGELDLKILDLIEETKIDEEVESNAAFELKMIGSVSAVEKLLVNP